MEYLTRQPEPVWQDVHSWGGFVFPLLKIFSLLKAEQVVVREFFYSSIASAGGCKQQEQGDGFTLMALLDECLFAVCRTSEYSDN